MENQLITPTYPWRDLGSTATAYLSPAANERDYATLVANHPDAAVFNLGSKRWNSMGLRFVTDDAADAWVVDVFASKGQDYFTRIATLTLTGGTQVGPATATDVSAVFVDTIAVTNSMWAKTITETDNAGADRIARLNFDIIGYDTFAFVATTAQAAATLLIQGTGY